MKLDVYKTDGSKSGDQVTLDKNVFGIEPNEHTVWQAVTAEMNNKRQGTSAAKNRSAVRGGGRKPWRQKGRGTARAGTIRSPLWVGGGAVFGPSPRCYNTSVPKKIARLARKSVLSDKVRESQVKVVEDFRFEAPKTKQMSQILQKLDLESKKVLILVPENNKPVYLSARNIPYISVKEAGGFSTLDVISADTLLIQKGALTKIKEVLG